MAQQSPIFVKTEAFAMWLLQHTERYPRHERLRLVKQMSDALFSLHEQLLRATQSHDVPSHLHEADIQLGKLRFYLRLALELRYMTPEQFRFASQHTVEIGKLLGGWLKKA